MNSQKYLKRHEDITKKFIKKNSSFNYEKYKSHIDISLKDDDRKILRNNTLPWMEIDLSTKFPYKEIEKECQNLYDYDLFVEHRSDAWGWKSLCLWGLSPIHTGIPSDYGLPDTDETLELYGGYTDMCKFCPVTTDWLQNKLGYKNYTRVRFMVLEPGGYIMPHKDMDELRLSALNLAITHPEGCTFSMENFGKIPWEPGKAFKLNIGYNHAVYNDSDKPRFHMIIWGNESKLWEDMYKDSFNKLIDEYNVQ